MAHLSKVVSEIAGERGVHFGSVSSSEIKAIERILESGSIDINQAISHLEKIDKIRLNFERADYDKIKKGMK